MLYLYLIGMSLFKARALGQSHLTNPLVPHVKMGVTATLQA